MIFIVGKVSATKSGHIASINRFLIQTLNFGRTDGHDVLDKTS